MTKRSRRNQGVDIVSETQLNTRWFYGHRSKISVSDHTSEEWSQLTRNLFSQSRSGWITGFISMVCVGFLLSGGAIGAVKNTGFSFVSVGMVLLSIVVWSVAVLYLRKFLTTPAQHSKPKHHRKRAS